jgi:polyisoprenoid-binding protein YceI
VTLDVEINGFIPDPSGGTRVGFSATAEINRDEFSVNFNGPIPGTDNAMVLSNKVNLTLEVEASLKASFPGA